MTGKISIPSTDVNFPYGKNLFSQRDSLYPTRRILYKEEPSAFLSNAGGSSLYVFSFVYLNKRDFLLPKPTFDIFQHLYGLKLHLILAASLYNLHLGRI